MTKVSQKKRNAVLSVIMILALVIGGAFAYLTDHDSKVNNFTIGKVDITLHEDDWFRHGTGFLTDDENTNLINDFAENVVPGQKVSKAPYIENTGRNDAYIFVDLAVPGIYTLADPVEFTFDSREETENDALNAVIVTSNSTDGTAWNVQGYKRIGEPITDIKEIGDFSYSVDFGAGKVKFTQVSGVLRAGYENTALTLVYEYKDASNNVVTSSDDWASMTVSLSDGTSQMPVIYSQKESAGGIDAGTYLIADMGYTTNPFGSSATVRPVINARFGSIDYTEIFHKDANDNLVPGFNEGWKLMHVYTDETYDLNYNNVTHLIFKYKNNATDDVLGVGQSTNKIFDAFRLPPSFDENVVNDITNNYETPQKTIVVSAYAIQSDALDDDVNGDEAIWNVFLNSHHKEYDAFTDGRVGFVMNNGDSDYTSWKMIPEDASSIITPSCESGYVWSATNNAGNTVTVNGGAALAYSDALNGVVFTKTAV